MSTNFYFKAKSGPLAQFSCLHVGKSSVGWEFVFQAFDEVALTRTFTSGISPFEFSVETPALSIRSAQDWRKLMKSTPSVILDEYNVEYTFEEFWDRVKTISPGNGLRNHFDELVKRQDVYGKVNPKRDWKDSEGFAFSMSYFS